jgi:Amt family ammonium transporter
VIADNVIIFNEINILHYHCLVARSLLNHCGRDGLVRRKNILSVLMQCLILLCIITLQRVLFGYSLTFGPDTGKGIVGGLDRLSLRNVGHQPNIDYAATMPHYAFIIFQCMFAAITPAFIIGTYAWRIKFSALLAFTVLWATFVYDSLGPGTGGWLKDLGALDFDGGIVFHTHSSVSALVLALLIGEMLLMSCESCLILL